MIDLPVTLLRDEPTLAAALRARWRFISVDEYQDLDAAQYALLRLLTGLALPTAGFAASLFATATTSPA